MRYDVAIVGGGVAGLQAALTLARSRRSVLLIDAGKPRHRFAAHMHNFIGADGVTPGEFYAHARQQLAAYPEITFRQGEVAHTVKAADGFTVTTADGESNPARTLLFACGVQDVLPAIDGLAPLWGSKILHCSHCHGYEARDQRIALLSTAEDASMLLESIITISPKLQVFFTDAPPSDALRAWLDARGMAVVTGAPARVTPHADGLELTMPHGQVHHCDLLFLKPQNVAATRLPFQLGCNDAHGVFVATDAWGRTSAPGVYVAGDMAAGHYHQFAAAAKSGMDAAVLIHAELTRADLA